MYGAGSDTRFMNANLLSSECAVVIVNWNSWDVLSRCLNQLQRQTYQNFGVVVIDNGSDQPITLDFSIRYPNVRLVLNRKNVGFAAANNQAIMLMDNAKWMVLLNPDAFPESDWLEQLMFAAEENPEYAAFASRQIMADTPTLLDGDGDCYHISGRVWRQGYASPVKNAHGGQRDVFSPCAAAAMYSRDALVSAGGFDEDFFCYVEDVDLGFRMRLLGYRALLVPRAVVQHVGSATSGGRQSDFAVYHGHRNLVWTYVKNMPGCLFWLLLPLHIAMNLASIMAYFFKGRGGIIFKAKRDALYGLSKMWNKRQLLQSKRAVSIREIWHILDKRILSGRKAS